MDIPGWYALLLLAAAAYRTWTLLAKDDILNRPRRYVTRLGDKWRKDGDPLPAGYRLGLANFLDCPWCLGAWTAFAWWGAWQAWPHVTIVASAPLAISALLALISRLGE